MLVAPKSTIGIATTHACGKDDSIDAKTRIIKSILSMVLAIMVSPFLDSTFYPKR